MSEYWMSGGEIIEGTARGLLGGSQSTTTYLPQLMEISTYAIIGNDGSVVSIDALYYQLAGGFFNFYRGGKYGDCDLFESHTSALVESVIKQKQYTEQEIMDQIKGGEE